MTDPLHPIIQNSRNLGNNNPDLRAKLCEQLREGVSALREVPWLESVEALGWPSNLETTMATASIFMDKVADALDSYEDTPAVPTPEFGTLLTLKSNKQKAVFLRELAVGLWEVALTTGVIMRIHPNAVEADQPTAPLVLRVGATVELKEAYYQFARGTRGLVIHIRPLVPEDSDRLVEVDVGNGTLLVAYAFRFEVIS
jgi:hypothetical protein